MLEIAFPPYRLARVPPSPPTYITLATALMQ